MTVRRRMPTFRTAVVLFALFVLGTGVVGTARAEAPFFYDPLGTSALYDPDFYPMNRVGGLMVLLGQAWSDPDGTAPRQALTEQDYTQQYRLQWNLALDPRYSLLVELKGSSRDRVVGDDYFLKTEFFYQGMEAPLFVYGGMRVPRHSDFMVYGGLESMSYSPRDLVPPLHVDIPVAFRGFAEVRYDINDEDPVLRLQALAHTLPIRTVPNLLLSAGIDSFYREGVDPRWLLEAHAEYGLPLGFIRLAVVSGYSLDLDDQGEQRVSLGARAEVF